MALARSGMPTTGLLTATQYLKDNRLLPRGFEKSAAPAEIAVHGAALGDADFTASGDRVRFAVDISGESIGFRWAHNLEGYDAPEPIRFVSYYRSMSSTTSMVVATATAHLPVRP